MRDVKVESVKNPPSASMKLMHRWACEFGFRGSLSFLVIVAIFALGIIPSVHAQTTSVTVLSSPSQVAIAADGTAVFDVTAQVTYSGYSQANNILSVTLMTHGTFNPLRGTVSSSPDSCNLSIENSNLYGYTVCFMKPSASSGTETIKFTLVIFNAQIQQYHLDVNAGLISTSAGGNSIVRGSTSTSDFYLAVGSQPAASVQPQTAYTLPSPVTLNGGCGSDCWDSGIFVLRQGTIQVTVSECQYCEVFIDNTNRSLNAAIAGPIGPFWQSGSGSQMIQTFRVADTGTYQLVLGNDGDALGTVSSVVVVWTSSPVVTFTSTSEVSTSSIEQQNSFSSSYIATASSPVVASPRSGNSSLLAVAAIVVLVGLIAVTLLYNERRIHKRTPQR